MIKLSKITLKNFKVFDGEPYTISFEDHRLILFDGPNGYGKTSVFDAIELGITGNITRLISLDSRQNPKDVVVAHQDTGEVEVILEFKDADSNIRIFQRKLKSPIPNSHKKVSKFTELWVLNEIVDGIPISSTQHVLDQYFSCKDFTRDFLLFHYVQQEETSRFLKTKSETQRAEELAQLFGNTREADDRLKKLMDIYGEITKAEKRADNRIVEIKRVYKIADNASLATGDNEPHLYALPWLAEVNKSPFWDAITIPELNQEKLNSSLAEIINIKNFVEHKNYFLRSRRFENAIQQREVLELYIGYFNSINDHDSYVSLSQTYQLINSSHTTLKSGDLKKIRDIKNIETIFQALSLGSSILFETALQSLVKEENKSNGLSSIYSELLKHHDSMSMGLNKLPSEISCLLCGQDYRADAPTVII